MSWVSEAISAQALHIFEMSSQTGSMDSPRSRTSRVAPVLQGRARFGNAAGSGKDESGFAAEELKPLAASGIEEMVVGPMISPLTEEEEMLLDPIGLWICGAAETPLGKEPSQIEALAGQRHGGELLSAGLPAFSNKGPLKLPRGWHDGEPAPPSAPLAVFDDSGVKQVGFLRPCSHANTKWGPFTYHDITPEHLLVPWPEDVVKSSPSQSAAVVPSSSPSESAAVVPSSSSPSESAP
jgi:hypothetical protein